MNILIVGVMNGKGSYQMRAVQLGAAIGARVTTEPFASDWHWADLIVLVKRAWVPWAAQAQATKKPIVWDALDFWRQPAENQVTPPQAKALLLSQIAKVKPAVTICATQAMADACGGVYVPHHSWAGLVPTNARAAVATVGYEGNPVYLGQWRQRLEKACKSRGWRFVINPPDLQAMDLLVAFRDGPWDGWICGEWKSGVKVANAIAAGRPLIGQDSSAVHELGSVGSIVESGKALDAAFDVWSSWEWRTRAVEVCEGLAPAMRLETIAARYLEVLQSAEVSCAA